MPTCDHKTSFQESQHPWKQSAWLSNSFVIFSGDFSSFAGEGSSEDENNEDGPGKKSKVHIYTIKQLISYQ